MQNKFKRYCPKCTKELYYSFKHNMLKAEKNNVFCKKCAMNRVDVKEKLS
ncbi:MAG: hypothetical protein JETCAE03_34030 [Ignavibacteriaceae bacterium]|nr:MAG: hypothetical protein JETCAE03_34030 [Ignavibacteriaceae bacterium]